MRIAIFSHSADLAGAERALLELTDDLVGLGTQLLIVLPRHGPLEGALERAGAQIHVGMSAAWAGRGRPIWKKAIATASHGPAAVIAARAVKGFGPELIVTNSSATPVGAAVARLLGRPHISVLHELGLDEHGLTYDLGRPIAWHLQAWASALTIAPSRVVAEEANQYTPAVEIVPQSCRSLEHLLTRTHSTRINRPPGDLHVVQVGTLQPGKRQHDAVAAIERLTRDGVSVSLTLVGPGRGSYADELERQIKRAGISDHVTIAGPMDNALAAIEKADVVLSCANNEAFGRTLVEGMRAGKPVVAAASGGHPELIEDGVRGLLFEPADVDGLAETLRRLAADSGLRRRLGDAAKQWIESELPAGCYGERFTRALSRHGLLEPT